MPHSRTIGRTLAAALAAATLIAPSALAQPTHGQASVAAVSAQTSRQHPHSSRAAGHGERPVPTPPTWPLNPQPISTPSTAAHADDGATAAIALGIGGVLALGGIAGLANHSRRTRRRAVA